MKKPWIICLAGMGVLGMAVSSQAQYILVSENLGPGHYLASSVYAEWPWMTPDNAFDGSFEWDATHMVWLSGGGAPQWIEVDLGQPRKLAKVLLCLEQYPAGNTTQRIYFSNSPIGNNRIGATLVHTFNGYSAAADIREVVLPSLVWARYVQVYCSAWPNNPALREVQLFELGRLTVDFGSDIGPVTYRGSGFLNGYGLGAPATPDKEPFAPGDRWVVLLKPQALATHPDSWSVTNMDGLFDIYDHARNMGVKYIQVKISDRYGYGYNKEAPWPGDNGNWKLWEDCVETMVKDVLKRKMVVQWDIFNEPTPGGFWAAPGGTPQYLEAWRRAVVKIRSLDPNADIIGPGMAGFHTEFLKEFLRFCKKHQVLPDVLMWHDTHRFSENVKYCKQLLAKEGIRITRFAISEYTGPANSNNAGYSAMAFADLERAQVESACRTVNNDPHAPDVNIAIHHTLGGLVTPHTFKPRATWWVFKRYADMTGRLYAVTPTLAADAVAAWDPAAGKATILLGRSAPETADEGIEVICKKPGVLSSIIQNGQIRVIGERIRNLGWAPMDKPEIVMDTHLPVQAVLKIPVAPMGPSDAFCLTLCKPSKDCPMIQPASIKKTSTRQAEYPVVRTSGIVLDGHLDDWKKATFIDLVKSGAVKIWLYYGEKDLSGQFALCWDDKNLYLGARLVDNVSAPSTSADTMYFGDSIQIALNQETTGTGWFEIGLGSVLEKDNPRARAFCFIAPTHDHPTGLLKDVRLVVNRQDTVTTYEAAIPWKVLAPMNPKHPSFRFSLLVNDNDGTDRKGWIEWGGGIGDEKAVSKFRPCRFVK